MILINRKKNSCNSSAEEAYNPSDRADQFKACKKEYKESFTRLVDLYHEKLFNEDKAK